MTTKESNKTITCKYCKETYYPDPEEPHTCDVETLRRHVETLQSLAENLVGFMAKEFAWSFSLDDGVSVKVEFHSNKKIDKRHVAAFAAIFNSVAQHYSAGDAEADPQ